MGLIDADRLMKVLSKYDENSGNFCFENEYECGRQQMLETIRYEVDDVPTVDAIPINWIMTQVEERVERGTAFDISVASILRTMVKEWRDEQTD